MTSNAPAAPKVLLVDDDDDLRKALGRALRLAGFAVEDVPSGELAFARLDTESFDCVVSDISMPGMTGLELLRNVRSRDLDLPVVLMTAGASVSTAVEAVKYGALRYLIKPFDIPELTAIVLHAVSLAQLARTKRDALVLLGRESRLLGDRTALEAGFADALEQLYMAYQPIVSFAEQRVFAYEALVRSGSSTLGNPGALFDAATRLGRLHDLGRAIRHAVARTPAIGQAPHIFVNLHTHDLTDETLFSADGPLTPLADRIVLEVTERASLDEVSDAAARVARLRRLGFRIAVDDLGAGYAGLTSFAQLQPDVVKLDMALIRGVDTDETKRRLVGSLITVCRDLKMRVVSEGIETAGERDALLALGGDLFQGYFFARPERSFPAVRW